MISQFFHTLQVIKITNVHFADFKHICAIFKKKGFSILTLKITSTMYILIFDIKYIDRKKNGEWISLNRIYSIFLSFGYKFKSIHS